MKHMLSLIPEEEVRTFSVTTLITHLSDLVRRKEKINKFANELDVITCELYDLNHPEPDNQH